MVAAPDHAQSGSASLRSGQASPMSKRNVFHEDPFSRVSSKVDSGITNEPPVPLSELSGGLSPLGVLSPRRQLQSNTNKSGANGAVKPDKSAPREGKNVPALPVLPIPYMEPASPGAGAAPHACAARQPKQSRVVMYGAVHVDPAREAHNRKGFLSHRDPPAAKHGAAPASNGARTHRPSHDTHPLPAVCPDRGRAHRKGGGGGREGGRLPEMELRWHPPPVDGHKSPFASKQVYIPMCSLSRLCFSC
jgi:hypothetical protein